MKFGHTLKAFADESDVPASALLNYKVRDAAWAISSAQEVALQAWRARQRAAARRRHQRRSGRHPAEGTHSGGRRSAVCLPSTCCLQKLKKLIKAQRHNTKEEDGDQPSAASAPAAAGAGTSDDDDGQQPQPQAAAQQADAAAGGTAAVGPAAGASNGEQTAAGGATDAVSAGCDWQSARWRAAVGPLWEVQDGATAAFAAVTPACLRACGCNTPACCALAARRSLPTPRCPLLIAPHRTAQTQTAWPKRIGSSSQP